MKFELPEGVAPFGALTTLDLMHLESAAHCIGAPRNREVVLMLIRSHPQYRSHVRGGHQDPAAWGAGDDVNADDPYAALGRAFKRVKKGRK